jgi:outer membrane protein assembly factor BamB
MNWKWIYLGALCLLLMGVQNLAAEEPPLTLSRPLIQKWLFEQGDPSANSPSFQGETLYAESSSGVISAILLRGGQLQWRSDVGGVLSASPVADEQAVYVASESVSGDSKKRQAMVMALSKTSGITIWSRALVSPVQGRLLLQDKAILGASKDGRVYSLDKATGELKWSRQYPFRFSGEWLLNNQRLIIDAADGTIICVDSRTGEQLWRYRTQGSVRVAIAASGSKVFVGTAEGYLTALEETGGGVIVRWRRRVGTSVVGVAHTIQGLVAITGDNFVQLLSHRRGARLWKRRMPGRVWAQPLTESRSALFASLGGDDCIVLSLESGKQVNVVSVGEGNDITAMPILTPKALIIPTRRGLMAFGQPDAN